MLRSSSSNASGRAGSYELVLYLDLSFPPFSAESETMPVLCYLVTILF